MISSCHVGIEDSRDTFLITSNVDSEQQERNGANTTIMHAPMLLRYQLPPIVFFALVLFPYAIWNANSGDASSLLILASIALGWSLLTMFQKTPIPKVPYNARRGTWFGHLMSEEGAWTNIPVVLCATYSFVFCYGAVVASLNPGCHNMCIPIFYLVGLLVFYAWHWAAHVWEDSILHHVHMLHHQDRYPPNDFYGDKHSAVQQERDQIRGGQPASLLALMNPVGSMTSTWAHEGPLLLAIVAILLVARFGVGLSTSVCVCILVGYAFMGLFGSAVHISFHERDFELEPYAWYRELRSLHMIHHMHRKNYAMVNVLLDIVFCSLMLSE